MKFGLIGYPLGHSFSKAYFTNKFMELDLCDFTYENFQLPEIGEVQELMRNEVFGLNITIPYKTVIINYLNDIDLEAWRIGAVNALVRVGRYSWKGYNTDASGFRTSLEEWLSNSKKPKKALVLGSGGSSKAVCYALGQMGIASSVVSRSGNHDFLYEDLTADILSEHRLIINATPLGMDPETGQCPDIPYHFLTPDHWVFDLVYNPTNTLFLTRGQQQGARTKNGLDMLHYQAEHAWAIWKSYGKF